METAPCPPCPHSLHSWLKASPLLPEGQGLQGRGRLDPWRGLFRFHVPFFFFFLFEFTLFAFYF